jgi:hypothetical protein
MDTDSITLTVSSKALLELAKSIKVVTSSEVGNQIMDDLVESVMAARAENVRHT